MAVLTVWPYGCYVNPRAAAGRRAGDSKQDFPERRAPEPESPHVGFQQCVASTETGTDVGSRWR